MIKKCSILILILLLISCGFHLRRSTDINISNLVDTKFYIKTSKFNDFSKSVRSALIQSKAKTVTNDKDADYIINIEDVEKESQLNSLLSGTSNNVYKLSYTVTYSVIGGLDNKILIPSKSLNVEQLWKSNTSIQLAQNDQKDRIYKDLQSQLVNQIVTQIAASLSSKK